MRNSRSSSFEILLRFEIGRKFEGSDLSRPGFLIKGLTIPCLKIAGKQPSAKDKFANVQISSEKMSEHDFRSDVGMKSSLHSQLCCSCCHKNSKIPSHYASSQITSLAQNYATHTIQNSFTNLQITSVQQTFLHF